MVRWSLAPKWPILVHFCGMDHQKPKFLLILEPFLSEAVEDSQCYFFENWFMKLKFPNLLKPLGTKILQYYWSFYPSELIYFAHFTMRHPVVEGILCRFNYLLGIRVELRNKHHVTQNMTLYLVNQVLESCWYLLCRKRPIGQQGKYDFLFYLVRLCIL